MMHKLLTEKRPWQSCISP